MALIGTPIMHPPLPQLQGNGLRQYMTPERYPLGLPTTPERYGSAPAGLPGGSESPVSLGGGLHPPIDTNFHHYGGAPIDTNFHHEGAPGIHQILQDFLTRLQGQRESRPRGNLLAAAAAGLPPRNRAGA